MTKKLFSVTAVVTNANSPGGSAHVYVHADDEEDARVQATNKIQRDAPHSSVRIGTVRESR